MINNQLPHQFKKITVVLFFIFSAALTFQALSSQDQVQAQQISSQNLIAIPPKKGAQGDLRVQPGETITTSIRFKNASNQPLKVKSFVQDFIVKADGKTPIPVVETVSNRWSLAKWMVVTPNFHQVAPKETVQMQVLIQVPEDAMPGGHYAMIIHEPTDLEGPQAMSAVGSGAAVNQRVGTLFYVTVEGMINEEAYIRNFEFNKFQEFGPVPYAFKINNQSDIHITPRMNIDIFNMLGQKKESIQIQSRNIFPLNSREFAGKWDKIWGFGLYKAKLTASYGTSGKVSLASTNFWILPIRIILAILFLLLLLIAIYVSIKRHLKHRYEQEEAKIRELEERLNQYEQPGSGENSKQTAQTKKESE